MCAGSVIVGFQRRSRKYSTTRHLTFPSVQIDRGNGAGKSTLLSIMGGKKMVPRNVNSSDSTHRISPDHLHLDI